MGGYRRNAWVVIAEIRKIEWDVEATGIIHVPVATSQHPVNVNINIETFNNHPGATFNDNSTALQPSADNQKLLK